MRIGLISDVHGNTEALNAVLAVLRAERVDAVFHLGDAVGYGAEPNECCDVLRREAQVSLLGNHDAVVAGLLDRSWFALHARLAAEWTTRVLRPDHLQWLANLPDMHREGSTLFCHGSPIAPRDFRYVLSRFEAQVIFGWMVAEDVRLVFVGHAHQCFAFSDTGEQPNVVDGIVQSELDIKQGCWVINVGSVGQPRDGDPRAAFGIFDVAHGRYQARRVAYDWQATAAKIRAVGLPDLLAARLALGR